MILDPQSGVTAHFENLEYPPSQQQTFTPATQTSSPILEQVVTRRFTCFTCSKTYATNYGLKRHQSIRKSASCLEFDYTITKRTNRTQPTFFGFANLHM